MPEKKITESYLWILKQTKKIQEHMEKPGYPLPEGSQSGNKDGAMTEYVLI